MSSQPQITEKLLSDAGGWQAMKAARALWEAGRVTAAEYAPPVLKGLVRDEGKEFRAGLKIAGRANVENICSCRASRQWGAVCAHSLAVGLAFLRGNAPGPAAAVAGRKQPPASPAPANPAIPAPTANVGPAFSTTANGEAIALHVVLSPNFDAAWQKDAITVGVEAQLPGRRVLLHALNPAKTFRCDVADLRLIEALRSLHGGSLAGAGMSVLPRAACLRLLQEGLAGHPRVSFGKTGAVNVAALLGKLSGAAAIPAAGATPAGATAAAVPAHELADPRFSLALEGSLNFLSARLQAVYADGEGERRVTAGATAAGARDVFTVKDPNDPQRRLARNLSAETAALARLTRSGFAGPEASGEYVLKREPSILAFFAGELPKLEREWEVSIGARFAHVTSGVERITPRIDIQNSGQNWFDLSITLAATGGQTFSAAEIQQLLRSGQKHTRLKNNRIAVFDGALLEELHAVLRDCDPQQTQPGTYRLSRAHAGYVDSALGEGATITGTPEWGRWSRAQRQLEKPAPVPLGALEERLRPYQKEGVYWMNFLARNGLGGVLADEMGLGKTLQALAFLRAGSRDGGAATPSLIVCPASLVYNWQREAARWTPELRTLVLAGGSRRGNFAKIATSDLVITSYPLLRRDIDEYRARPFATVILDEAQHIKNPDTQNAQAAAALKSAHRFALTGTPVENSVRDLWSLMHFLMPGYLGSRADFQERYQAPINAGDAEAQARLAKRVRPFVLRRRKREVAADLPEKLEQVVFCELTDAQKEIYVRLVEESRRQVQEAFATGRAQRSPGGRGRMVALTALLRLRQAACDLRLLNLPNVEAGVASGKLDLLDELLREATDGGHRVLVFSQFVSMLKLIVERLERAELAFCYLDGSTPDRMKVVDRFQNDASIPVFLISLTAGGVGLNLTGANTVIHFDPWWNPAVEAQATDRAHRIGQEKTVTSYKLIARSTVEEKILDLQRTKRKLVGAAFDPGVEDRDGTLMSHLSMEEIGELLSL